MQEESYAPYRDYLREGARVEIGIPLAGGGVFRDWATISWSAGDELLAQISRDVLPANVRVDTGFILDVSIRIGNEVYTCSGIVLDRQGGRVLKIQLFGNFTLRERRQFFRIWVSLRLRYAFIDDGDRREIQRDWAQRRDLERMKFEGYDDFVIAANKARYVSSMELQWKDPPEGEVNLGGGGIFLRVAEPVQPEELLALEISVPTAPPRKIQAVAQVIHVRRPRAAVDSPYMAGVQFLFIDERDRDLLFRQISVTQIALLRQMADRRELPEQEPFSVETVTWQRVVARSLLALVVLVVVFYLVRYLIEYTEERGPNEIQKTYQKSIKKYRHEE